MLYDNENIYEILFVSWCLWCKHKVCHTKQTYIFKITAKVILFASRKSKYLVRNEGVNEVLTHRLTRVHMPHTNIHTRKHTQNITWFMEIGEILWKPIYLRMNSKKKNCM